MSSETDEQFVERMGRAIPYNSHLLKSVDLSRLFALARRGAAVDGIVEAAMQGIDHVSRFNSPERTTEARAMVRKASGETSDGLRHDRRTNVAERLFGDD